MAIAIVPYILIQGAITQNIKTPPCLKFTTLIAGSIALLIKPHFLIIPFLVFCYRIYKNKDLKVIKDADFITLTSIGLLYTFVTFTYFNDYLTVILPDVLQFYLGNNDIPKTKSYIISSLPFIFICIAGAILTKHKTQQAILLNICLAAAISLFAYGIQMKGFFYHIIPFYALTFPLCAVLIYKTALLILKRTDNTAYAAVACILICGIYYHEAKLNYLAPKHDFYTNNSISKYIDNHCTKPCAYYMTYMNMDIISQFAFYSPHEYATRFPTFWFLAKESQTEKDEDHKTPFAPRFTKMIAEDIKNYHPNLILDMKPKSDEYKSTMEYLKESAEFRNVFRKYKKIDTIGINRKEFYAGSKYGYDFIIEWDVYKYEQ